MRRKTEKGNYRKFSIFPRFGRRGRLPDETDWIVLEAELSPGARVRPSRRPAYFWPVRIAAVAVLGVSIPIGLNRANNEIFYENEEFVLRQLTVKTDGVLSEGKLREVANVSPGMKLMEIDLGKLKVHLEKLPIVKGAVVVREMPDRINISVTERKPVAWLSCPPLGIRPADMERGYLLDKEGVFFRCMNLTETEQNLPVIETYRMDEPREGQVMSVDGTTCALDLIAKQGKVIGTEDLMVHAVKLRNEWSFECLYRGGMTVTFSILGVDRGLKDLGIIMSQIGQMEAPLATVNVAVSRNIPVTFSQPIDPSAVSVITEPLRKAAQLGAESFDDTREKHLRSILKSG
ncbi:MAG: FtsQ-type POTRA domain-containing protein [Verrucomicrobiota bacterium]|nr:FtsQ-type POTRA domain-containing protein [Verrucomicrobiota bacterium]